MKWMLLIINCLAPCFINAQQPGNVPRKTFALVVGIANYAARGIPKLKYANKDAEVFVKFLQTAAGGNVPKENITLLLDSNATTAAVYAAMSQLRETAGKNDLVYFYFAGHGDMESETIYKLGFLLTYNTPRTNYINNAIRIEDLNNFANTLSLNNKANVVLITDACHSGQLAGNQFKGNLLVGEQLRTIRSKEIRITSCANDELAMEDERWGGGRGVFSFYLINGLSGLADEVADGFVTLAEIRNYLATSFSNDPLLKEVQHKQTPVLQGANEFALAVKTNQPTPLPPPVLTRGSNEGPAFSQLPEDLIEDVFKFPELANFETALHFDSLLQFPSSQIPAAALSAWQQLLYNDTLGAAAHNANKQLKILNELQPAIKLSEAVRIAFNRRLVIQIHDRAQQVINLALEGDVAELERRRYYNATGSGYDAYPAMFALALQLTDSNDYLYRVLQVNKLYFSGLAAQIKIPTVSNPKPLITEAMRFTLQALALEKNAAYIYNQLGSLQLMQNDFSAAEKQFFKAVEISPQWAIPWSNLVGLYATIGKHAQAEAAFEKAIALQPGLQNSFANAGYLYEMKEDYLFAEELQRKSISLNSRHYFPFERLANIYLHNSNYAAADSFYFEAGLRKQGFYFSAVPAIMILPVTQFSNEQKLPCAFDSMQVTAKDVPGNFAWGLRAYERGDVGTAEQKLKIVIAVDSKHPLAFHYLGKLLAEQKRRQEAAVILDMAIANFLDTISFKNYIDSLPSRSGEGAQTDCLLQTLKGAYYPAQNNHYLLGRLHEEWQHFAEAEASYASAIALDPQFVGGYYKLSSLQEKLGRYLAAERTLQQLTVLNPRYGLGAQNSFYLRLTKLLPGEGYWFYKAGQFCYDLAAANSNNFIYDRKAVLPDDSVASFVRPSRVVPVMPKVFIPVLADTINLAPPVLTPMSDGIRYLAIADSLLALDDFTMADINEKIADLYSWQGLPQQAVMRYEKAIALQPLNASTRSKIIAASTATFQNRNALHHLQLLKDKQALNFRQQMLLAELNIYAGKFYDADTLIMGATKTYPYPLPDFNALQAKRFLLSGQYPKAIKYYQAYLREVPGDDGAMYSIARSYAKMNKPAEAWRWLQAALQTGFAYAYVLENDPCWIKMRSGVRWKEMIKKHQFVTYTVPPTSVKPD